MSYRAYLNNEELFFDTELNEDTIMLLDPTVVIGVGMSGSFTFELPEQHKKHGQLRKTADYLDVFRDGESDPLFSGRVFEIKDNMDGTQKVQCEGAMAFLSDTIFRPETFQGKLHALVARILTNHNSQVESIKRISLGSITVENANVYREYLNYETSISRLKDLAESFGGYMMVRKRSGVYYLDWLDAFTTPCTQKIVFGSNLLNITKTINSNDLATVIIPLGAKDENGDRLTIKSVNSNLDYLTAGTEYIAQYGYITKAVIWDDVTTAAALKTKGQAYLQACLAEKINISVSAVDLADAGYDVDSFRVAQKIAVKAKQIGQSAELFSCVKQTLKLLDPGQNRLELGEVKEGFVQTYSKRIDTKFEEQITSAISVQIKNATELITGNKGGYVVLHDSNADTFPDEVLVMDSADVDTAVKVWRWNKSGLGYSSTGYDGTYGTAMTMDGHIVGDFLAAYSVTADKIATGAITVAKIDSEAVTAEKIKSGAVTAVKIENGAVYATKIATGAVTAEKIYSGAVTTEKLAAGAVTAAKIAAFTITADEIAAGAITASKIAADAITASKIAAEAVTAGKIAAGAVTADKINVADLFSQNITASNFNITGGSIRITTSASLSDIIELSYDNGTWHYNTCVSSTGFVSKEKRNGWTSSYGDHYVSCSRNSNNVYHLDYDSGGQLRLYNSSGTVTITCKGSNGTITTTGNISGGSDIRLKDDIEQLDYKKCEQLVYGLKPVNYKWKADPNGTHHGFIAQDVESLLSDIYGNSIWKLVGEVNANSKDPIQYKTLSYMELLADIVATIQSQNNRIKTLELKI